MANKCLHLSLLQKPFFSTFNHRSKKTRKEKWSWQKKKRNRVKTEECCVFFQALHKSTTNLECIFWPLSYSSQLLASSFRWLVQTSYLLNLCIFQIVLIRTCNFLLKHSSLNFLGKILKCSMTRKSALTVSKIFRFFPPVFSKLYQTIKLKSCSSTCRYICD